MNAWTYRLTTSFTTYCCTEKSLPGRCQDNSPPDLKEYHEDFCETYKTLWSWKRWLSTTHTHRLQMLATFTFSHRRSQSVWMVVFFLVETQKIPHILWFAGKSMFMHFCDRTRSNPRWLHAKWNCCQQQSIMWSAREHLKLSSDHNSLFAQFRCVVTAWQHVFSYSSCTSSKNYTNLCFDSLQHPTNSLDLAPCDYHVFGIIKEALRERKFSTERWDLKEKKEHKWLQNQTEGFSLLEESRHLWSGDISVLNLSAEKW